MNLGASANNSLGNSTAGIGTERAAPAFARFFGPPVIQDRRD